LIIDPSAEEILKAQNYTSIVLFNHSRKIPYMISKGKIEMSELETILSLNLSGCVDIMKLIHSFILKELGGSNQ